MSPREAMALLWVLGVCACNNVHPPVLPQPFDASDAAPWVAGDGGPNETPCQRACDVLERFCGPQLTDCATSLAHVEADRAIRTISGKAFTCADLADAGSKAAVQGLDPSVCP